MDEDTPADFALAARTLAEAKGVVPTLQAVVSHAVSLLGCDWAAIAATEHLGTHPSKFSTSNDEEIAAIVADVAGAATDSPGITAFVQGRIVVCNNLETEERFAVYAKELVRRTPIRSVLSIPLRMNDTSLGVLSCYSHSPEAFGERAVQDAGVLAVHAVVAVAAALDEVRADNLEIALLSSRTIGAALGILMERFRLTSDDAWEWLRKASQDMNRPLAVVAAELVETGILAGLDGLD